MRTPILGGRRFSENDLPAQLAAIRQAQPEQQIQVSSQDEARFGQ
jgi:hypothetical protein